ncbi:MAG: LysE/ArgO family amino acid transporter [Actinomycetota bacterium]
MFLSDSLSTAVLPAVATGLVTCLALLSSLGAQNLLLLRHGLRRDRTGLVVGIFLASDIVLVIAGVAGLAGALSAAPAVRGALSVGGAVFLLWLAYGAARRALRPAPMPAATVTVPVGAPAAPAGEERPDAPQWPWAGEPVHHDPWWVVAAAAVAVTWLNPQVLLETAFVLGTAATSHGAAGQWWFVAGSVAASTIWFGGLGFGARTLTRWLSRPGIWRGLEAATAVVMTVIALGLLRGLG